MAPPGPGLGGPGAGGGGHDGLHAGVPAPPRHQGEAAGGGPGPRQAQGHLYGGGQVDGKAMGCIRLCFTLCSKVMEEMSVHTPSSRSVGVVAQLSQCMHGPTLRPLALSLMLHTVQIWCGFNVIIFKV